MLGTLCTRYTDHDSSRCDLDHLVRCPHLLIYCKTKLNKSSIGRYKETHHLPRTPFLRPHDDVPTVIDSGAIPWLLDVSRLSSD
jgi:hypothetical protein